MQVFDNGSVGLNAESFQQPPDIHLRSLVKHGFTPLSTNKSSFEYTATRLNAKGVRQKPVDLRIFAAQICLVVLKTDRSALANDK
jgi:hypothetical protein